METYRRVRERSRSPRRENPRNDRARRQVLPLHYDMFFKFLFLKLT